MKILVVIPPSSFVNYPIAEAGTYIEVLRCSGHECDLKELNLLLLDEFNSVYGEEIKKSLNVKEDNHPIFIRSLGDIFDDKNHAYVAGLLNLFPRLIEEIDSAVRDGGYDAVLYLFQWLRTFSNVLPWLISLSKRIDRISGTPQFLAGQGLRSLPNRILDNFLKESSIKAIILGDEARITEGLNQQGIWDGGEGDLDLGAPIPDMSDYRLSSYLNPRMGSFVTNVYFSRGCRGECLFCNERYTHCSYRMRHPLAPALHMKTLHDKYGFNIFRFSDSRLNDNKEAFFSMVDGLIQECTDQIYWVGMVQANMTFTPHQAERLYHSGCRALWVGVETGDEDILRYFRKDTRIDYVKNMAKTLSHAGILMVTLWINEGPWETISSVGKTKLAMEAVAKEGAAIHVTPFRLYEKSSIVSDLEMFRIERPVAEKYKVILPYECLRPDLAYELQDFHSTLANHKDGEDFFYDIEGNYLCSEL